MKKLMIAAVTAAVAGGAFATPMVYDYKASAKHMYEKLQRVTAGNIYVKYVKSSKLQGYFIQDLDGASTLAKSDLTAGWNGGIISEKRGFLVLINKSAEKDYRRPKIMPAQLDVKTSITSTKTKGATTTNKLVAEAYLYAGPFASAPDTFTPWDPSQDDGLDYLFNNGAAIGAGPRSYGTVGSTLYMFGQHNTYNRFDNTLAQPATICAFGDSWLNGAGFGVGDSSSTACCGWGAVEGKFKSISGSLKGGLFLCSIGGYPANSPAGYFALGLEDAFRSDVGNALGKAVQGDDPAADLPFDENLWADGDIALSTTDVVSGSWTLKPSKKFDPVELTPTEDAWFTATGAPNYPASREVAEYVKGANQKLLKGYNLTVGNAAADSSQPEMRAGKNTVGLIPWNFAALYF